MYALYGMEKKRLVKYSKMDVDHVERQPINQLILANNFPF